MLSSNGWRALVLSLALVPQAVADICATLEAGGIEIEKRISLAYQTDLTEYWSTACGDLKPTCIAAPSSAAEMAQVIKNLHDVETLLFVPSLHQQQLRRLTLTVPSRAEDITPTMDSLVSRTVCWFRLRTWTRLTITPRIILLLSVLAFHGKRPNGALQERVGLLLEVEWEELESVDIWSGVCGSQISTKFISNDL